MPPLITKQAQANPRLPVNGKQQVPGILSRIAPLNIDEEEGLKVLLYGQSGSGKTTLWATFPGPILAVLTSGGFRPGELRSINTAENREKVSQVVLQSSSELKTLYDHLTSPAGKDQFATIVFDHVSGLQDLILKEVLGLEVIPAQKSWGMAQQQQYGQCVLQCKEHLRNFLSLPQNVVIIAQERVDKDESGSDIIKPNIGAAVMPSLASWLNPACDYILQTFKRPKMEVSTVTIQGKKQTMTSRGKGVEYCIRTEPHDVYTTKFRVPKGKELPDVIVNPSYDKIVALLKGE